MSENKDFLKSARYIIRYMQSGNALVHMEKNRVVRLYELLAEKFEEEGKTDEADEFRRTAEEYKNTSRYCDELEKILAEDQGRFYSYHYKNAYQNLLNEYVDLGNTQKVLECERMISRINRREKRSRGRASLVSTFQLARQKIMKHFKYRFVTKRDKKYGLIDWEKQIRDFVENEVTSAKNTTYSVFFESNELLLSKPAIMPKEEGSLWIEADLQDGVYSVSARFTYSFDDTQQTAVPKMKMFPHIFLTKELYGDNDFTLTLPQKNFPASEKQEVIKCLLWFVDEMIVLYNAKCNGGELRVMSKL